MEHSKKTSSWKYAIPFFVVLAALSIVSFLIPLRPEVSYLEKRELKKFPEFSAESLVSGEYFSDIALWFSDTFPGRENWISLSQELSGFYGYGDISIQGARPIPETMPTEPEPEEVTPPETTAETEPETIPETTAETEPEASSEPTPETEPEATEAEEATAAPAEQETEAEEYQRTDVQMDLIVNESSVVQLGDTVFYPVGFSQYYSDLYVRSLNKLAERLADTDARVISAIPPTAVGIIVPEDYLSSIRSYPQSKILEYLNKGFDSSIISVDTVTPLQEHKDEYLFFHTDHHWTATGAYYAYRATCEALDMVPAELDEFEEMDQGTFIGSIFGKATNIRKLGKDNVLSYDPIGNITMYVVDQGSYEYEAPIVRDMRDQDENSKYVTFLHGDEPMVHIVNEDLPEGSVCLIIKDSFGNCFVPYFSKNYHDVYAIDYRKYYAQLPYMVSKYNIQDIIFAPNMMSVQSDVGSGLICDLCGIGH